MLIKEKCISREISWYLTFNMAVDAMAERNRSLKEVLLESLSSVLSPNHDIRIAGEEQVKALEVTEGIICFQNV